MNDWQSIETAPKDGSPVWVKRVYENRIIAEGFAAWRTVKFPALYDPLSGERFAEPCEPTGWMRLAAEKRFPEPTHWLPSRPWPSESGANA